MEWNYYVHGLNCTWMEKWAMWKFSKFNGVDDESCLVSLLLLFFFRKTCLVCKLNLNSFIIAKKSKTNIQPTVLFLVHIFLFGHIRDKIKEVKTNLVL